MESDLCKLCSNSEQVNSHILPKFIFKWLKKTGTGRLRSIENVNLPREDGIVKKFLCKTCENKFNKAETYFANKIFYPVINDRIEEFDYDERLRYFIISLFWRTLKDSLYEDVVRTKWFGKLLEIEKDWADYLYLDKPSAGASLRARIPASFWLHWPIRESKKKRRIMYNTDSVVLLIRTY